jgi:ribosomal-protein-alanine N-acetyltransferase
MSEPVRLAPLGAGDEREILAGVAVSRALHEPWVFPPRDAEAYRAYLAQRRRGDALYGLRRFADGALVGVVTLRGIGGTPRRALLGFWALAPWAGRGYLRAGAALALEQAFARHRVERVLADVQPGNAAARALLARLGFAPDGSPLRALYLGGAWRPHERFALRARTASMPALARRLG